MPPQAARKRKRSRGLGKPVSLELIRNFSMDSKTPYQMASSGELENLKSCIEMFGITIKEVDDENQATFLHHAAAGNQIEVMRYLIDSGIKLNATDVQGHTALHVAVSQGHIEATNLLLDCGINDTILNKDSDAALHITVRSNNTNLIAAFLEHPEIDLVVAGYRKRTPLHVIAEYDNAEACEVIHNSVLIKEHFKKKTSFRLCAADEDDLTPIHLAARKGSHRVLDLFMTMCISHGYPPEVVLGFIDEENSTPLHAAIDGGHTKVVEVLLNHGANPVVQKDSQVPPFLLACSQGKLDMIEVMLKSNSMEMITCRDVYGQTCLHHCARAINTCQTMTYLVNQGAKVNTVDNKGQTPLMMSIIAGSFNGANCLLKYGADVTTKDINGCHALHHAIARNRKKIMTRLLELPSAATLVVDADNEGNSPIHTALKLGHCSLVQPMVSAIHCKLKNVKDSSGCNYIHLAAQGGDWRALTVLLNIPECLTLVNETNGYGGTPLHSAALTGATKCVEILLSHGAMIHKCHLGATPFLTACSRGHVEVARILFNAHPFQLKWTDDHGHSALHAGAYSRNPQMITLLLDIGIPVVHDFKGESFFDQIIEKNDVKCAAAVIEHDRYQECLDFVSPIHPHPMISLITYMPEIARKVLDRSFTKADVARVNPEYWERFDFKYIHLNPSPKHSSEDTKEETDSDDTNETKPMIADEKEMMQEHVIQYKGSTKSSAIYASRLRLLQRSKSKVCHLEALRTMLKFDRNSLLTHPISNAYLKSKWSNYGRWIHIGLASVILCQVLFVFFFTGLIPKPTDVQAFYSSFNSSFVCGNGSNGTVECIEFSYGANICRFIALALAFLNFVIWVMVMTQLRLEGLNMIKNSNILVDFMSVLFTVWYLIPTRGLNNAHWEAGAISVFFSWFSLVLRIQLFDLFGVYITMFLAITRRAFQVLLICALFIISFGLSFYILTGNLTQYSTIGYSLFVNFGHMLGEIDYEAFVGSDVDGELQFHWLTFIFVITLAILMSIVIMNLLIGLAVGDIDEIRSNAIAEKKSIEVSFFVRVDTILPARIIRYLDKAFVIKYPNHEVIIIRKLWRFFWESLKGEDPNLSDDDSSLVDTNADHQRNKEVTRLKERVEELNHSQIKIVETLNSMKETQENMMKLLLAAQRDRDENEEQSDPS